MAKHGRAGMYWASTNPHNQINSRKGGEIQHHQDQDAPRSGVSHIWYLCTKIPNVWKWQTRRVPTDDERLQDRYWRNGNHFHYRKDSIPAYDVTRGSSEIIWRHHNSSWQYNQWTPKTDQGVLNKLRFPLNVINKQKRAMRRAMRKPRYLQFKIFAAQLTELNNTSRFSLYQAPPRRWTLKSSAIFYYTPSQTLGKDKPTSRDGTLKEGPTRRHATCLNA